MKAISLSQPMAWAVFHGKDVENRKRYTSFRGRCYIHASKTFNQEHYDWMGKNIFGCSLRWFPGRYVHGAVIGEVDIVDCIRGSSSRWAFTDQYNLILKNPIEYDNPIPCKGTIFPLFFEPKLEAK